MSSRWRNSAVLACSVVVGERLHLGLERVDVGHEAGERLELLAFAGAEDASRMPMRGPMLPGEPLGGARGRTLPGERSVTGWPGRDRDRQTAPQSARTIDAAIFDLGGVIMRNGSPADFARRFPGLDPAVVLPILMGPYHEDTDHPWHRLERGEVTLAEARDGQPGRARGRRRGSRRSRRSPSWPSRRTRRWSTLDPRTSAAAACGPGCSRTTPASSGDALVGAAPLDELFDDVVDSHEVGMRKPNPAIYRLALDRLGRDRETAPSFLDDIASNVAAAPAESAWSGGAGRAATALDAIAHVRDRLRRGLTRCAAHGVAAAARQWTARGPGAAGARPRPPAAWRRW